MKGEKQSQIILIYACYQNHYPYYFCNNWHYSWRDIIDRFIYHMWLWVLRRNSKESLYITSSNNNRRRQIHFYFRFGMRSCRMLFRCKILLFFIHAKRREKQIILPYAKCIFPGERVVFIYYIFKKKQTVEREKTKILSGML